jgi:tetratricopeptide (TPR) repeat protein
MARRRRSARSRPAPRRPGQRRRLALIAPAALAAAGLLALLGGERVGREAGLDVLLITIDTLRADALGCYGGPGGATPWVDRVAREGVRFELAHAHSVVTLPSHANILSGRYPFQHGVRDNAGFRFPAEVDTAATLLERAGYRTAAFVSGFPLDSRFGLDRGFDVYEDSFAQGLGGREFGLPERRGSQTVALAKAWLDEAGEQPSFAWVHLYDPHSPYAPHEPWASRFPGQPYLGEVAAADAALGPLLGPLLDAGREARALVAITSDHGEGLGDHAEQTHGTFAYETTLRVPLVFYAPRILPSRAVAHPARHVDILPTVLDALGLEAPAGLAGVSLLPAIAGRDLPAAGSYFEALSAMLTRGWAPLYGVVAGRRKYVELPLPELYDLGRDPGEERNLLVESERAATDLREVLAAYRREDAGIVVEPESAETLARLAALGYVGAGAPEAGGDAFSAADDPKNLVELDAKMQQVIALQLAGDLEAALRTCLEVVDRRPRMRAASVQLAAIYRRLGRMPEAIATLREVVAADPEDAGSAVLLAVSLNDAGEFDETVRLLGPWVDREDPRPDALAARATALAQLGRPAEALADLERARGLDQTNPLIAVQIATVQIAEGSDQAAREVLEAAVAGSPRFGLAHHTLGLLALGRGDDAEAERRFRRALDLEPANADSLFNLAALLIRTGRGSEARPYLYRFLASAPPRLFAGEIRSARRWLAQG